MFGFLLKNRFHFSYTLLHFRKHKEGTCMVLNTIVIGELFIELYMAWYDTVATEYSQENFNIQNINFEIKSFQENHRGYRNLTSA